MSDLDALAETARNRGLKLIRSRVRTPTKRRFGKVGLTDPKGRAVFGMDAKGPSAKPDEVEEYLRNLGAKDWGASLDVAVLPRKRKAKPERPTAANDSEPAPRPKPTPSPKPKPKPKLHIRGATPGDAAGLVPLIRLLGAEVDARGIRKRITALATDKLAPLVATLDRVLVGLCGIDRMTAIHRDKPVGRINILVVGEEARGQGIGRMLVEAAEERLRTMGCGILEVTSNDRLAEAHAFYRHLGYERTSIRFVKTL